MPSAKVCGVHAHAQTVMFATFMYTLTVWAASHPPLTPRVYHGSARLLVNPDRGFRHQFGNDQNMGTSGAMPNRDLCHKDGPAPEDLAAAAKYNLTIAQAYCFLPTDPVLSPAFLSRVNTSFQTLRDHGIKALLRFLYDHKSPGEGNYTFDTIAGHIQQLAPIVQGNADQVYVLQAGFIGSWGEWHGSKNHLRDNATGVADMLRRELYTLLPLDRKVQVRVPEYKSQLVLRPYLPHPPWQQEAVPRAHAHVTEHQEYPSALPARLLLAPAPDPRMAFGLATSATPNTAVSRIGFDNDGFMSTSSDGGTWPSPNLWFATWGEPVTSARLPLGTCGSLTTPLGCSDHGAMVAPGFSYAEAESPYVPIDGEMYWNAGAKTEPCPPYEQGWPAVDGHTAAWRLRALHYDTLSLVHGFFPLDGPASPDSRPNETISAWTHEQLNVTRIKMDRLPFSPGYAKEVAKRSFFSTFDYIRDHLGYRLEVAAASFPDVLHHDPHPDAPAGAAPPFTFAADVINYGFAAPVNPRPVQLVLLRHGGSASGLSYHGGSASGAPLTEVWRSPSLANPVTWQPRVQFDPTYELTRHRIQGTFTLPPSVTAGYGNLTLALALPDARQHMLDHRSCIQLANSDTEWVVVGNEGMNILGTVRHEGI